jgi:hypothetical protein
MRAVIVLAALVATPFALSAAQGQPNKGRGHDAAHCAARVERANGREVNKCPVSAPQPPPPADTTPTPPPADTTPTPPPPSNSCAVTPPSTAGSASASGMVFLNASPWNGLGGWCVTLTGPVSATVMTDANGRYSFTGLPAGDGYTVCEVVQNNWRQTWVGGSAPCPTGMGYAFSVSSVVSFLDFGNVTP